MGQLLSGPQDEAELGGDGGAAEDELAQSGLAKSLQPWLAEEAASLLDAAALEISVGNDPSDELVLIELVGSGGFSPGPLGVEKEKAELF